MRATMTKDEKTRSGVQMRRFPTLTELHKVVLQHLRAIAASSRLKNTAFELDAACNGFPFEVDAAAANAWRVMCDKLGVSCVKVYADPIPAKSGASTRHRIVLGVEWDSLHPGFNFTVTYTLEGREMWVGEELVDPFAVYGENQKAVEDTVHPAAVALLKEAKQLEALPYAREPQAASVLFEMPNQKRIKDTEDEERRKRLEMEDAAPMADVSELFGVNLADIKT